ncbi:MAG TPA: SLBB domain-containing protein [bacterium]|jgi:polysaccharide export outer membrane protein|nr:SLBB domain-containing protein [bacterium]
MLGQRLIVLLLICVLATAAVPAAAQQPYLLGPGDVIEVSVFGYPDLTRLVPIMPDGKVSLPLVGTVTAEGLTVDQFTAVLTRAYAAYIRNPQVSVSVREFRKVSVSILGQVARPGTYALTPGARILDLISAAGGVTDVADLREAHLVRPGQPPQVVDLQKVLAGDPAANFALAGGETLVVREDLFNLVNIVGEVVRPGQYRLRGEMRVLDVLLLAGGLKDTASLNQSTLVRRSGEREPLRLDRLLLRQEMEQNVIIRPGDTLIIPLETNNKFFVLGDVRSPGQFVIRGAVTLLEAVAMAGGPIPRAFGTARRVYLVRRTGTLDRPPAGVTVEKLEGGGVLLAIEIGDIQRGSPAGAISVQPGDVIVIPESGLSSIAQILSILAGIRNVTAP